MKPLSERAKEIIFAERGSLDDVEYAKLRQEGHTVVFYYGTSRPYSMSEENIRRQTLTLLMEEVEKINGFTIGETMKVFNAISINDLKAIVEKLK